MLPIQPVQAAEAAADMADAVEVDTEITGKTITIGLALAAAAVDMVDAEARLTAITRILLAAEAADILVMADQLLVLITMSAEAAAVLWEENLLTARLPDTVRVVEPKTITETRVLL